MDKPMLTGLKVSECNQCITEFSKDMCISSRLLCNDLDRLFNLVDTIMLDCSSSIVLKYGRYKDLIHNSVQSLVEYSDDIRFLRARVEKLEAIKNNER